MPIQFECPNCRATLKALDELAGRRVRCKKCGAESRVPGPRPEFSGSKTPDPPVSASQLPAKSAHASDLPPMPVETKKCPSCGAWIESGSAKCRHCKTHFDEAGQPVRRKRKKRRVQEHFQVGEVVSASWEILKEDWITSALVYLTASLILTAVIIVPLICLGMALPKPAAGPPGNAPQGNMGTAMLGLAFLAIYWLLLVGVGLFVNCGLANVFLRMAKGDRASFDDFWAAQHFYFNFLVNYFVFSVIVAIGTLLLVVPGFVAILILWPVFFTSIDDTGGGLDPLIRAYEIGKKNTLPSLGLMLLAFLFLVLGELMCGVGVLIAVPLDMLMFAVAYCMLTGQWNERTANE